MIKKILFVTSIIICFVIFINDSEETMLVNQEDNNDSYQLYYLSFEHLTTKNFNKYFDDNFKIIGIYPYINPIYINKINDHLKYYPFKSNSNSKNLTDFTNNYLEHINFYNEKEKYLINGIPIKVVKVYASTINVYKLLKNYTDIKYNFTYEGTYKKID